jgi:membrane protease subunit HflC
MNDPHDHDHDHDHGHDHEGHDHGHHHHAPGPAAAGKAWPRLTLAVALVLVAALAATLGVVRQGTALVVTRFGDPVRVQTAPGLAWRLPAPIERGVEIDLRLHTTATGLHDVGTRDGLRLQLAAFAAWRVPGDAARVVQHLRAVRGDATEAANQLRTFLGSALETESSRFALADLLNTDPAKLRLAELEAAVAARLKAQLLDTYGVELVQVGIERLGLPDSTVTATINRMIAERQTAAEERKAHGVRLAAEITENAYKESRITRAKAEEEASATIALGRTEAAAIYGQAQAADPELYAFLRGLDTLDQIITSSTRLVLRTDAMPFRILVDGPGRRAESPAAPVTPAPAAPVTPAPGAR